MLWTRPKAVSSKNIAILILAAVLLPSASLSICADRQSTAEPSSPGPRKSDGLIVAPTSLKLRMVPVGSAAQAVRGTNKSSSLVTVSAGVVTGPFASTGASLPVALNASRGLKLDVPFTPAVSRPAAGTLTINSAAGDSPTGVIPIGTGPSSSTTVEIHPGANIPSVVAANPAGTTFVIYPGTYRLQAHIVPKTGDSFIGQTACAPPKTTCPAILSGSRIIGPLAKFDGTDYEVTGQTQQGIVSQPNKVCEPGYLACNLPEDLFFDDVPYQHLYASSLPTIGPGQWWFDYTNHIIYFHDDPAGHTVETSVLDTAFDSAANNVTIQYLAIKGFANPLQRAGVEATSGNVSPSSSLNWVIRNCELSNNHGAGVRFAFGTQVLNSYLHDNGNIGVAGGTRSRTPSGVIIQGNTITHNNYAHVHPGWGGGGIKFGDTANAVVRGNTVTNNEGTGIHFDVYSMNVLVDGNTVTDNTSGGGFAYEISLSSAIVRNNVLLRNGPGLIQGPTAEIGSYASVGVNAYCNVLDVPNARGANGIAVIGSNRGNNSESPGEHLVSTENAFHHNTVIWEAGARGGVGHFHLDAEHQPNFFASNTPPDYNTYHLSSLSGTNFVYDNDNTQRNIRKTFAQFQAAGADVHGTADTNYTSGFPTVVITSPADQSSVANTVTVTSAASDPSGISKVEFYVDWNLQATVKSSPYNFDWSTGASGSHTVAAMAYSKAGIRACYAVTVNKQ
jgi:parallel beta-helix repeat protein